MKVESDLDILQGGYRLVREIGRGGMGVVYEARNLRLDRRIAVKMLHPYLFSDHIVAEKLLREARLAARIEHANVVRVYDVEIVDGRLAIEMQYIEGGALPEILASGPLPGAQAADLLGQILDALSACHAQGIIHCDLKPGNLLVSLEGRVYLSDFGIAKALSVAEGFSSTPRTSGPLWGTPQYSPPEVWHGAEPTAQWDLYAAGVIVYEALLGQIPFEGRTPMAVMLEKQAHPIASIATRRPDLSKEFAALVDELVSPDAARRPASAQAAQQRLAAIPVFSMRDSNTQPIRPVVSSVAPTVDPKSSGAMEVPQPIPPATTGTLQQIPKPMGIMAMLIVMLVGACVALGYSLWNLRSATPPSVAPPYSGELSNLTAADERLFFSHDDGVHGRELWCINLDGEPWMVADINPGPQGSNPRNFFVRSPGSILFSATTEALGEELWNCSSDRPEATVSLVRDILPGPMGSEPVVLSSDGVVCLMYATTIAQGRELWASNGREGQTALVEDLALGKNWSQPMDPCYLRAGDHTYVRSFTSEGQRVVRYDFASNSIEHIAECDGTWMAELNGRFYYDFPTSAFGRELWCYDPATKKAELFKDITPGGGSSNPSDFFVFGGRLYFQATTDERGAELWVTDGNSDNTYLVKEFHPGGSSGSPHGFINAGDFFYLRATSNLHGMELFRSDGRDFTLVTDLRPGTASSVPYNMTFNAGWLYFSADDGVVGEELWRVNTADAHAQPELLADLLEGPKGAEPHLMRWANETTAYFIGNDEAREEHIYRMRLNDNVPKITRLRVLRPEKREVN